MRAPYVSVLWLVPAIAACSGNDPGSPGSDNVAAGVGGMIGISAGNGGSGGGSSGSNGAVAGSGVGSSGSTGDAGGYNTGGGGSEASGGNATSGGASSAGAAPQAGSPSVAGSGGAVGAAGAANPGGPSYPFVFSVFNDAAAVSSLQIYTSDDALNFKLLLDTGYGGPTGNLRDPSIMKHSDGKFYVAFTTPPAGTGCCGAESSFSVASSADLKKWTTVAKVDSGVAGTVNTWAPEWFKDKDGSIHILASIDKKTYRYEPTDATLTKFGGGTWIGIGPDYIDTFIVTIGATYHAFTKRESTRYIEHATATSLDGPWTFVGTGDWAKWGTHREAGALIQLENGTWRFYCDAGSTGHEVYSDSSDVFQTWTPPKGLPTVGNSISHGTVIRGD